jgi:hypothetical protein
VEREVWLDGSTKADLRVTLNGTVTWVDVSIVAPHGVKYIALGSNETSLVAAMHREQAKRKHYARAMQESVGSVTLVPFVLEITGAVGKSARDYLDKMAKIETAIPEANEDMARKRRFFKKIMSVYLAIGNEHCLRVSRNKMRAVRRQQAEDEPILADESPQVDAVVLAAHPLILNNGSTPPFQGHGREADGDGSILAQALDRDLHTQDSSDTSRKADDEVALPPASMILTITISDLAGIAKERPANVHFGQGGDNAEECLGDAS